MDAFAVSVCKGLSAGRVRLGHALTAGIWFGGFQALMPFLGWLLGSRFAGYIQNFDHWVAFFLLAIIGGNMLREAFGPEEDDETSCAADARLDLKQLLLMAVATSIDALAVGITLALLPGVNIAAAVLFIGFITFILSAVGLKVGNVFGLKYKNKAEMVGGAILILMGLKILLEHLGVIQF